jgi:acyl-coenzyme A thioesterase PaaI-like protein
MAVMLGFQAGCLPTASRTDEIVHPPSDGQTLLSYIPMTPAESSIEEYLQNHPILRALNSDARLRGSRPLLKIPPAMRPHNYSAGALAGPGKIAVPPMTFTEPHGEVMYQVQHLGSDLCGEPGVVHTGLLTTLMDEGLARACFPALPNKVGVTANLKLTHRARCPADGWTVLKAETQKVEGRKVWVKGALYRLKEPGAESSATGPGDADKWLGEVICEGEALFIEPKYASVSERLLKIAC